MLLTSHDHRIVLNHAAHRFISEHYRLMLRPAAAIYHSFRMQVFLAIWVIFVKSSLQSGEVATTLSQIWLVWFLIAGLILNQHCVTLLLPLHYAAHSGVYRALSEWFFGCFCFHRGIDVLIATFNLFVGPLRWLGQIRKLFQFEHGLALHRFPPLRRVLKNRIFNGISTNERIPVQDYLLQVNFRRGWGSTKDFR